MGHERKRGKLADLNAFLRGGGSDAFSLIVGNTAVLSKSNMSSRSIPILSCRARPPINS